MPLVNFKSNNQSLDLINQALTQTDFLESNIWDSKKIVSDFKNIETRSKKIRDIWKIVGSYYLTKGFVKRKVDSKLSNKRMEVSYNKLEQII